MIAGAVVLYAEEVIKALDRGYVVHNFLSHSSDVDSPPDFISHADLEIRDALLETRVKNELISSVGDTAPDPGGHSRLSELGGRA